jgi:hypothetical protein
LVFKAGTDGLIPPSVFYGPFVVCSQVFRKNKKVNKCVEFLMVSLKS